MALFKNLFEKKQVDSNIILDETIINEMTEIEYFSCIGIPFTSITDFQCEYIPTIEQVMQTIDGIKWENKRLDEYGNISAYLCKNHKEVYNSQWNKTVAEVKSSIIPAVDNQIEKLYVGLKIRKTLTDNIRYDILGIAMALVYRDYIKSEFYLRLLQIYKSGHIPCGWKGKNEHGYFLIY